VIEWMQGGIRCRADPEKAARLLLGLERLALDCGMRFVGGKWVTPTLGAGPGRGSRPPRSVSAPSVGVGASRTAHCERDGMAARSSP